MAKYKTKTEAAIQNAMLELLSHKPLADITISELSREAHVSRSTFYEHYGNTGDVYDSLVDDVLKDMSPLMSQVVCSDGFRPKGKPFCALVRDAGSRSSVVEDARFADMVLSRYESQESHDLYTLLADAGYTDAQARAICSFQMSGCYTAARSAHASDAEWADIRAVIDRFILGGIAACLAAKK